MSAAGEKKIGPGFRFGKLTAASDTGRRKNGCVIWNCDCTCGGSIDLDIRAIQRKTVLDCSRRHNRAHLEAAKRRVISSNTSGHTGIYRSSRSGKWAAQITFKGKTYCLDTYDKIEDAVKARKRGEETHDDFLEWYHSSHAQKQDGEQGNAL